MKRPHRALHSIRWRLTLALTALLALLLTGFAAFGLLSLRQSLISSRVALLQDDVNAARALFARTPISQARGPVLCTTPQGGSLVARTVATTIAATSGHTVTVVVYDRRLTVVAEAPASTNSPHLNGDALRQGLASRSQPEILPGPGGGDLLVVGFPIRQPTPGVASCGVAQLATSMAPLDAILRDDLVLIVIGAAAALLLAVAGGVALTGRALRPLRRLAATADLLAAGKLHARSGVEPREDEIGSLARSFDVMAERIETSFDAQQRSEERTRRFIADASHELRTPVTAIGGYIDVIRMGATASPEALDSALAAMSREAQRLRELVLDLLTLARLDADRSAPASVTDVSAVVTAQLDQGVLGMPADVTRDLPPGVHAMVNPESLGTVVRNLLVNACTYAPGAPQRWRAWQDGATAMFSVSDAGPGIPAADLPHVLERFYRGEKARARSDGGSGLGLSIVQSLAQAAGGHVHVASAPGEGTTVTVSLPTAAPRPPVAPRPPAVPPLQRD